MAKFKVFMINSVIVFTLYGNLEGMIHSWKVRFPLSSFWDLQYFSNLFYIYGVFLEIHTMNKEFVALGYSGAIDRQGRYPKKNTQDLNLSQYFQQPRGEVNQRLFFAGLLNQPLRISAEYRNLADKIKQIHNRQFPRRKVEHVSILLFYWPASSRGYYYRIGDRKIVYMGGI